MVVLIRLVNTFVVPIINRISERSHNRRHAQ
jgi:hypothetical protein